MAKSKAKTNKQNVVSRSLVRVSQYKLWQQALLFAVIVGVIGSSSIFLYRSLAASQVKYWNLTKCRSSGITVSISQNNSHGCVKGIQAVVKYDTLTNNGCPGASSIGIDGVVGPITSKYIKCFQKYHNLTADGVVGPRTYAKMIDVCWYYVNHTSKSYLLVNYCGPWSTNPYN